MAEDECHTSALGSKEFWDERYALELSNFEENGDEGEIWFGKSAETRMVKFLESAVSKEARILDVGCGNGSLLRRLRVKGYSCLKGIDYSSDAIVLAEKSSNVDIDSSCPKIEFEVADMVTTSLPDDMHGQFDVVLDKGTWDAISLGENRSERLANYRRSIHQCLSPVNNSPQSASTTKYFVIVSCNFTKDELIQQFSSPDAF
uniref:Protein-lysine N-methyltransferase n=1 Tax=Plectus sambesii TaxID=2011161 RepID=A0A914VP88_9BILA